MSSSIRALPLKLCSADWKVSSNSPPVLRATSFASARWGVECYGFHLLPEAYGRSCSGCKDSVIVPEDDRADPAPATTFIHLDATTVLSRGGPGIKVAQWASHSLLGFELALKSVMIGRYPWMSEVATGSAPEPSGRLCSCVPALDDGCHPGRAPSFVVKSTNVMGSQNSVWSPDTRSILLGRPPT